MEFSHDFQKLCQVDTRKLLLMMAIIASSVLFVQFLSIPYGNVLLSLFPSGKVPLIGTNEHSAAGSLHKSKVIYGISPLNNSIASNSSGSSMAVRNTDEHDLGENANHANEAKRNELAPENDSELDEDFEKEREFRHEEVIVPRINSRFGNVENTRNGSAFEKAMYPDHDSPSGKIPFDNARNEGQALTLERAQSKDSSSIAFAPALPPVASGNSNVSFVLEQAANTLSKDKKTEMGATGQAISTNTSTITSKSVQKDSMEIQTGEATSKNNQTVTSNSNMTNSLEMPARHVTSISDMNILLLKSHASSGSMIPRWSSERDQEVLSAKAQIMNVPILKKDRDLYAPIYRNVSMFKRSYELMEKTLKVYVYKEGAQPIFHRPETKGIYASEGWFMKQMEGNRQFSVNDPRRAHLFYLPFSTRRLEQFLYVPNSHSHKNLVEYLKKYLDLISGKYPFWNRTGGADHFLVACHDWAPTETKQHMNNCIRALCNADISEDFAMGKDVSLPETNVRLAREPLRDLGGKPPGKREILAFFAGSMHGYVRPILLQYWENKDPDMQIYGHMGRSGKHKSIYAQHMKNSKYCICAKGYEVNSPRVVEAIFYECVPVIVSDNFVPPFFEVLNWETFAIFVPEKDIPNLKNILLSIPQEKYLRLQMRVRKVQQHFLWNTKPKKYDIFHMILHSIWYNRVFQINLA